MIDFNAKLGHFPYRPVEGLEALLRAMDRHGVEMALVSSLQAVFYRNPQDGNDELAAARAPHRDRFLLSAVLRPNFTGWQDDLLRCAEDYGARAVLLGAQAACWAFAKKSYWKERETDYDSVGVQVGTLVGIAKAKYNSIDYGVIALDNYAAETYPSATT